MGDESLAEAAVLGSGTILAAFAARAALCRRSVAARHSRSTNCLLADRENPNSEEFVMFGPLSVLGSVSECGVCIGIDLYLLVTVHTESLSVIGRLHLDLKSSDAPPIVVARLSVLQTRVKPKRENVRKDGRHGDTRRRRAFASESAVQRS